MVACLSSRCPSHSVKGRSRRIYASESSPSQRAHVRLDTSYECNSEEPEEDAADEVLRKLLVMSAESRPAGLVTRLSFRTPNFIRVALRFRLLALSYFISACLHLGDEWIEVPLEALFTHEKPEYSMASSFQRSRACFG
jgi:hypothetical protein